MIRYILNHVPRGVLQLAARWMMPLARVFYAGQGVECPLCGGRFRRMMPYGYVEVRPNALCPRCLSLERHRLLWLWLEHKNTLSTFNFQLSTFLHIAPEACLQRKLEAMLGPENYVTADLESPLARVKADVQALPFGDGEFDVVFCNHVLEHVADDRRAMRELHRVMRPGGWGVMLSPVDGERAVTFEDDSVTDPTERTRIFGQYDHRRVYGRDYADRLREAGFTVEEIDWFAAFSPADQARFALRPETLYVVSRDDEFENLEI